MRRARPSRAAATIALTGWLLWAGVAGCGQSPRPAPQDASAPQASKSDTADDAAPTVESADDLPAPRPLSSAPTGSGMIRTLRDQVSSNPALRDADPDGSLLQSLDRAHEIFTETKARNREAIRQAGRQPRVGAARRSPHLILLLAEDLAPAELGSYGRVDSVTPHLDALAAAGRRFTQHYAGGTEPRSGWWTLMTGRNVGRAPRSGTLEDRFALANSDLADWLWNAGYQTAYCGWWPGADSPVQHHFDAWSGFVKRADAEHPYPPLLYAGETSMRIVANQAGQRGVDATTLLQTEVESLLERLATGGRPGYLQIQLPPVAACAGSDSARPPREASLAAWDRFVGHLQGELQKRRLDRRTCVIFTALAARQDDAQHGRHGLGEGNLRVPLIVSWNGEFTPKVITEHISAAWDVLPTCLELGAAQRTPPKRDGLSFVPALRDQPQSAHNLLYWESTADRRLQAVRKGRWKGIASAGAATLQLYDLESDPDEAHNVASQHPDVVEQLLAPPRASGSDQPARKTAGASPR